MLAMQTGTRVACPHFIPELDGLLQAALWEAANKHLCYSNGHGANAGAQRELHSANRLPGPLPGTPTPTLAGGVGGSRQECRGLRVRHSGKEAGGATGTGLLEPQDLARPQL